MKIKTEFWMKPIPMRNFDWSAWDEDTYDGAPDSGNRHHIGHGSTEAEAIKNLMDMLTDEAYERAERRQYLEESRRERDEAFPEPDPQTGWN